MFKEPITVHAKSVDCNRVPFVKIWDIQPEVTSAFLYLSSNETDYFKDTKEIELPYTSIVIIQKLKSDKDKTALKIVEDT